MGTNAVMKPLRGFTFFCCTVIGCTFVSAVLSQFRQSILRGKHMDLSQYLPVLLFLGIATAIGVVLLTLGTLLGPKRSSADKLSPYECGFEAFEDARMKFDVRYYLMAILFIVFDLEIAFILPWSVVFRDIGIVAIIEMAMFLLLLVVGFAYVWKKGALEWE